MKKRILIFNWWDIKNPKAGGAEVHLDEIFSRLAKDGFEITLLCSKFKHSKSFENINGIKVIRKGSISTINIISFVWYLIHQKEFDLVIDYTNKIPYLTCLYARRKSIAIAHHVFGEIWQKEWGAAGNFFAYFERLFYRLYKNSPIVAVSQSTKEELIDLGLPARNIKVIYNGISAPTKTGIKSRKPLIVFLGRLKKYKRIDLILEAMPTLIKIYPKIQLIIMGRGSDAKRLKKIVAERKIQSHVKFLGFVSEPLKLAILRKAWLNIQLSIKEGWGFSVLEAAACGTPTLAANVSGLKETIINGKTGWLFEKNNLDEFSSKLKNVLLNEKILKKAGALALKHSRKFNWDKTAQLIEKEIHKLS